MGLIEVDIDEPTNGKRDVPQTFTIRVTVTRDDETSIKVLAIVSIVPPSDSWGPWPHSGDSSSSWETLDPMSENGQNPLFFFQGDLTTSQKGLHYLVARVSITDSNNIWSDWCVSEQFEIEITS